MISSNFLADTTRLHYWSGDISRIGSESSCVFIWLIATLGHRHVFFLPYSVTCKFVFLWAARLTAKVCANCSRCLALNVVYIADKNDTQAWKGRGEAVLPVPRVPVGFVVDRVELGLFFRPVPLFWPVIRPDNPTEAFIYHRFCINSAAERMASNTLWKKGYSFLPLQMLR